MIPSRSRHFAAALVVAALLAALIPSLSLARSTTPIGPTTGSQLADSDLTTSFNDDWKATLARTGALGSYHDEEGNLVVVVPASGSSTFSSADARAFGLDPAVQTRDVEPADVAAIERLLADTQASQDQKDLNFFFSPRSGAIAGSFAARRALNCRLAR